MVVCLSYYNNTINKLSLKLKLSQQNIKQKLHVIQVLLDLEAIYSQCRQYVSKYKQSWLSYKHLFQLAFILEFSILSFPWITAKLHQNGVKQLRFWFQSKNVPIVTDGKLAFSHRLKKLWTKILRLFQVKIKYFLLNITLVNLNQKFQIGKIFLRSILDSAKTFIIKIVTDGSHGWKKKFFNSGLTTFQH